MSDEKTQRLAEKIALLLQENEKGNDDFGSLRSSIEKINERLGQIENKIENKLDSKNPNINYSSSSKTSSAVHPSQTKYTNLEELADEIINNLQNEKACPFEPTGKPCDHCAMCNSHGF